MKINTIQIAINRINSNANKGFTIRERAWFTEDKKKLEEQAKQELVAQCYEKQLQLY